MRLPTRCRRFPLAWLAGLGLLLVPSNTVLAQDDEEEVEEEEAPTEEDEASEAAAEEETEPPATNVSQPAAADAEEEAPTKGQPGPRGKRTGVSDVLDGMDADDEGESQATEADDQVDEADDSQVAVAIAEMTDIYQTLEKRRDPLERIIVDGPRAELWFLQGLNGTPAEVDRIRCQAYRWLFFGRLNRSQGAQAIFKRFSRIQEVRLDLFTIGTRISPDGRRGYQQFRKADPKMEITLTRETSSSVDLLKLRPKLTGAGCVMEGERVVDKKWYATTEERGGTK